MECGRPFGAGKKKKMDFSLEQNYDPLILALED